MKKRLWIALAMVFLFPAFSLAQESINISISWWGTQSRHEAVLEYLDAYADDHSGISFSVEYGPFQPYYHRITTQLIGRSQPDLFAVDYKWVTDFSNKYSDSFINILDCKDEFHMNPGQIDFAQGFGCDQSLLIGVPIGLNTHCFLCNATFFEEFGIEPEQIQTWDDLIRIGKSIHEQDPDRYLLFLSEYSYIYMVSMMLTQRTGQALRQADGSLGFTQEDLTEAFSYIRAMLDEGVLPPYNQSVLCESLSISSNPYWKEERVGIFPSWVSTTLSNYPTHFEVKCMPYPHFEDAKTSSAIVTPTCFFCISSSTAYPEQVEEILKSLVSDPGVIEAFGMPISMLSETSEVTGETEVWQLLQKDLQIISEGPNAAINDIEMTELMHNMIHRLGYNTLTPEEAARQVMEELSSSEEDRVPAD